MAARIRLGIAGAGNAGNAVLRSMDKVAGIELGAIADKRREALEALRPKYPGIRLFDSVEEMCASKAIDAVWIATPSEYHAENTVIAARGGKHVICEKPMALTLEDCDRMIEAAEKNNVKLLLHSKASDPPIVKMREVVASGRLGRLIQINTWNYKGWLTQARLPEEVDSSKGGGVLFRQGPHQVDIVRAIGGGKLKSVSAVTGRWNPHFDTEGNFTAFLQFDDGTPATLVFNGYGYFDITELTWDIGEGGRKVFHRYEKQDRPLGPVAPEQRYAMPLRSETRRAEGERKQPFYGLTIVSCEKGDIRQSPDGLYIYTENGREEITCPPFLDRAAELQKLYEAVVENKPAFTDGRWGKASFEVVLAIYDSSRQKKEIALKYQVA
ncbi:MAG TPA: Gfo/Idh/MocA family oxidoreductase [Candidatus Acidoferrales bacterium]|nr:Gfo/Idh/MocA family oxidoreductase [Candidatus Acidoferrales bacterium]